MSSFLKCVFYTSVSSILDAWGSEAGVSITGGPIVEVPIVEVPIVEVPIVRVPIVGVPTGVHNVVNGTSLMLIMLAGLGLKLGFLMLVL